MSEEAQAQLEALRQAAETLSTHSATFYADGQIALGTEYGQYADAAWWAVGRIEAQERYDAQERDPS